MDGGLDPDVESLREMFRDRDHALMRFETVAYRLLIDFRSGNDVGPAVHDVGPAVHVLNPVRSLRERIATIRRARPSLPIPTDLQIVGWPLRVRSLERLGILEVIRQRLADDGAIEAIRQLEIAIDELEALEQDEVRRAITGDGYRTLWPARSS